MLFHTWTFAIFFVIAVLGMVALHRTRLWCGWLLVCSYVFYGWWHPYYVILIVWSTLIDFYAVTAMDVAQKRLSAGEKTFIWKTPRFWLIASIVNNLGILFFFKYANFIVANLNVILERTAVPFVISSPSAWMPFGWEYVLPVGISFYTFQSMSYSIDFYRGHVEREKNFIKFATYVSFFPQLVAGPIERASRLLPQFSKTIRFTKDNISSGGWLFLVGLFKKVALANYIAIFVEQVFEFPEDHSAADIWAATFLFGWQIYFDFSGYTDMARGIARTLGFELCLNFNAPYVAHSLTDFWRRWHISLSSWFRDYVYIPLGGNRKGPIILYANLMITFTISGLWHGAEWTFIVWGAWHGLGLCLSRWLSLVLDLKIPKFISMPMVFIFVWIGWTFFRADNVPDALDLFRRMATLNFGTLHIPYLLLFLVFAVWAYQLLRLNPTMRRRLESDFSRVILGAIMIIYLMFGSASGGAFIYFQF